MRPRWLQRSFFARSAQRAALATVAVLAAVAMGAAAVRLLPWLCDPAVPFGVTWPFGRGLASLAIEAALFVGWPVGWALASYALVERGEARVLQSLGQRPLRTALQLVPHGAAFALALAGVAFVGARDANEPGRVVNELVDEARHACASWDAPHRYAVPFTELTWLCVPGAPPHLVGGAAGLNLGAAIAPPSELSSGASESDSASSLFTAQDARVAGDFRDLHLVGVELVRASVPPARLRVGALDVRGLAPFARASSLSPSLRAALFAATAFAVALLAALSVLRGAARGRFGAIVVGAAGPLAALAVARALERSGAEAPAFLVVLAAGCAAALAAAAVLSRLPAGGATASTT